MTLHRMAPVDAAWFHMDGTANLAMVTSVALTGKPLDFDEVKALYAARLSAFPRFRQRVVERGLPLPVPHWEDVPDFDIGQHLHHVALPQPGDRRALAQLLSDIVSTPLDRLQPLWVPHPGEHLGMGISILSYRGYATLAIVADAHLVPDPETITRQFQREFVTLLSAARRADGRATVAARVTHPHRSRRAR